jgi:hypothetical protein
MLHERSRRDFLGLGIAGAATLTARQGRPALRRPRFRLTTDETFDPRTIQPFAGRYEPIYAYIDQRKDVHVAGLQRWLRQPSISAQNVGITEMADMLRGDLKALGFKEAELVPTSGHPGVWGFYDAGAPKTLMVYALRRPPRRNPSRHRRPRARRRKAPGSSGSRRSRRATWICCTRWPRVNSPHNGLTTVLTSPTRESGG